ncbi:MAG: hypothetical protein HWE26_14980 [Alteromonadaceae bacterium]|nr:hypothetical protein [Alteromonadaceae bacterium]
MNKHLVWIFAALLVAGPVFGADSVEHSGQASKHSVLASVEGISTTASVGSAVVAAPIIISGGVTVSVAQAGSNAIDTLHARHVRNTKPLTITTRVITRDPAPSEVVIQQQVKP